MKLLRAKFALVAVGLLGLAAVSLFATTGQPLGVVNLKSFSLTPANGFSILRLTGAAEGLVSRQSLIFG